MKLPLLLIAALFALPAPPQSPTRAPQPSFAVALPGYRWHFPQDDFAHPAFANEWWYFTGDLRSASGHRFGFELTFFRIAPSADTDVQHALYFTHFAVTDISGHHYFARERARRGNWAQAGIAPESAGVPPAFYLWNENWRADFDASGPRHLHAVWDGQSVDLDLVPGARMLNGANGYSQKGEARGQASYYYSFPRIHATGRIQSLPVTGLVWMDHEFASNQLAANQQGWDWMGLHLQDADLMFFNLRRTNGARDPHSAGTFQPLGAGAIPLRVADFQMAPTRWWRAYPIAWRVQVAALHLDLTVSAAVEDQLFHAPAAGVNYWEGAVTVAGTRAGHPVSGDGYLELTGYSHRFNLLQSDATLPLIPRS